MKNANHMPPQLQGFIERGQYYLVAQYLHETRHSIIPVLFPRVPNNDEFKISDAGYTLSNNCKGTTVKALVECVASHKLQVLLFGLAAITIGGLGLAIGVWALVEFLRFGVSAPFANPVWLCGIPGGLLPLFLGFLNLRSLAQWNYGMWDVRGNAINHLE